MVLGWECRLVQKVTRSVKVANICTENSGRWFWGCQPNKNSQDAIDTYKVKARVVAARALGPSKIRNKQGE